MSTHQPFLTTIQGTRRFACLAVAVQAIILNAAEQVLLLSSPTKNRPDEWQRVSIGCRVDVLRPNEMGGIRRLNPRVAGFGKL
jgi:hypothetical protein